MKNTVIILLSEIICIASFTINSRTKKRIKNLENCVLMFENIETRICFLNEDVYALIKTIENNIPLEFLKAFLKCDRNNNLQYRWKESVETSKHKDCFKNDEVEILKSFSDLFGLTDAKGQLNNCIAHKNMIERVLVRAKEESERRGNLYTTLGVLSALGIIVLFI